MTPGDQRIAIQKACGWVFDHIRSDAMYYVPAIDAHVGDPLNDLNAMHGALRSQTQQFRSDFDRLLHAAAEEKHLLIAELEPKDWADCFILCLQLKRDSGN